MSVASHDRKPECKASYSEPVFHDRAFVPGLPMVHFPLGARAENNGKVDKEKHDHPKDLDRRRGVFVPGEPCRGEAEEGNGGEDEKSDWQGSRTRPLNEEEKDILHTASGTALVH